MDVLAHRLPIAFTLAFLLSLPNADAQMLLPVASYPTQLVLDGPIDPGPDQALTGSGAPEPRGVYVELWRVAPSSVGAESVASVAVDPGGMFQFDGVNGADGEHYYVTLSYCWHFEDPQDFDRWREDVSPDASSMVMEDGVLKITMRDADNNGLFQPYFQNYFTYNPSYYRVVEIRLRNPAAIPQNRVVVHWGAPWGVNIAGHASGTLGGQSEFETVLIPMGMNEWRVLPFWRGGSQRALERTSAER